MFLMVVYQNVIVGIYIGGVFYLNELEKLIYLTSFYL